MHKSIMFLLPIYPDIINNFKLTCDQRHLSVAFFLSLPLSLSLFSALCGDVQQINQDR